MHHSKWFRIPVRWIATVAIILTAATASAAAPPRANPARSPLWDDGRAEFSIYRGTTLRYGEPRPTTAHLIVVKEDLLRSSLVKSEAGPVSGRTFEALKLNFVADFPTGTYAYHQMATVMFDRASLDVVKESMSHTESCGMTYVRVAPEGGRWKHHAHSYWEGEAEREVAIDWPAGERLFWDALPVSLRAWVAGGTKAFETKVWVLPSQVSGHAPPANARPIAATLRMSAPTPLRVPAGRFRARRFELAGAHGSDRFWFDEKFPHVLLRMETHAGRTLALEKTMRIDYWRRHADGDEKWLVPGTDPPGRD